MLAAGSLDGRPLVRAQGERLPFADASFDHVTFTYLLRYVDDPAATMGELARVLRPGGHIATLEFGVPANPISRCLWRLYTRIGLPLAGRVLSPAWGTVGDFLGRASSASTQSTPRRNSNATGGLPAWKRSPSGV